MGSRKPQIAMFPSWGMGHFLPFVEFAKRMSIHHGFAVLIITPPAVKADIRSLASSVPDIRFVDLSAPHLDSLPMTDLPTKFAAMEEYKGPLKDVLGSLKDEISAFVIDFFCAALIESSAALHNPTYVLSTDSASNLCLKFFYDTLDSQTTESLKDMDGPVDVPGLPSMPARYFPNHMQDRTQPLYHLFLNNSRRLCTADGFLINTFHNLESGSIQALMERKHELLPKGLEKGP
ncbi:hypothetical protein SUGI_1059390 [Cryptomeria japonica]|nr:hypothetical protein SUGI_1059390 [Cryptomeria japonica]